MTQKIHISFIILVLILLSAFNLSAQDKNQVDASGRKQGYWEKRDPAGFLVYQGTFCDDRPLGEFKRYDERGKLKSVSMFRENGIENITSVLYPDGSVMASGKFTGQDKDSTWVYFNERKQLIATEEYLKGRKHGIWKTFYISGVVAEEIPYENDTVHGSWIKYFENGNPKEHIETDHGVYSGRYMIYFPGGNPRISGNYLNDRKEGIWTTYEESGEVSKVEEYRNGELMIR